MCTQLKDCRSCVSNKFICQYFIPVKGEGFCHDGANIIGEFDIIGNGDEQYCPLPPSDSHSPQWNYIIGKYAVHYFFIIGRAIIKLFFCQAVISILIILLFLTLTGVFYVNKHRLMQWWRDSVTTRQGYSTQSNHSQELEQMGHVSMESIL